MVVAAPVPLVMNWTLSITDASGRNLDASGLQPGQSIVVRGAGLPPGAGAAVELHSDPVALGQALAGADGAFALNATIPQDAAPGEHTVVVAASAPGFESSTLSRPVTIVAAPAPAEPEPAKILAKPDPSARPVSSQGSAPGSSGSGWDEPTVLGTSMRTLEELRLDPIALAISGGLIAGVLLMIAMPSVLLESTLKENYDRMFRWLAPLRRATERIRKRLWGSPVARWITAIALMLASSFITGFADPGFGLDPASFRLFLALTCSLLVLNLTISLGVAAIAKRTLGAVSAVRLRPAGLLVLAAGVLISRLAEVHPGLLFGAFVGLSLVTELSRAGLAKHTLLSAGVTTGLGLLAWLGYSAVSPLAEAKPGFGILLLQEILAATGAEALVVFVVLMLPLTFLDGKAVWDWSKRLWAVSYAAVLAIFALLLLPMPQTWAEVTTPSAALALSFGAFGLVSIAAWLWFRSKTPRAER